MGTLVPDCLQIRGDRLPEVLILVRLGRDTLKDRRLADAREESFGRWGVFGFSAFGLGPGGYAELTKLVPLLSSVSNG